MAEDQDLQMATFAAGCFWGVEEIFRCTKGVTETEVGYTGGKTENPSYEQVCTDGTGHAEAVQMKFDPTIISYKELLDIFFKNHNPTTMNRQGPDIGSQYRSVIFYHSEEQKKEAEEFVAELQATPKYEGKKIVTQIVPASPWYKAEEYHQKYVMKKGGGSCHV
ncbi:MAG: peptide-methionine (S)-S-oxide reductase MsrA [Candidatus Gracilibacteria bacterium]